MKRGQAVGCCPLGGSSPADEECFAPLAAYLDEHRADSTSLMRIRRRTRLGGGNLVRDPWPVMRTRYSLGRSRSAPAPFWSVRTCVDASRPGTERVSTRLRGSSRLACSRMRATPRAFSTDVVSSRQLVVVGEPAALGVAGSPTSRPDRVGHLHGGRSLRDYGAVILDQVNVALAR